MALSKIIFFPASADQATSNSLIITTLTELQFINASPLHGSQYLAGERFLSLLTFLGCSPDISLIPLEVTAENPCGSNDYSSISILSPSDTTRCLGFTQNAHPKCPECKKRIAGWKSALWQQADEICICDKCQTATAFSRLNWKHECGFGRCGFEVTHIYPHEAVPTDQLLDTLERTGGFKWQYCYANN